MEKLIELNKSHISAKLDAAKHLDDYVANDVIVAVSSSIERDKRIINDFGKDELYVKSIVRNGLCRSVRLFTKKGIERYVKIGKIFDYKNVCKYFDIVPEDKEKAEFQQQLERIKKKGELYYTSHILKWLFEKRKQNKILGEYCSITSILFYYSKNPYVNQKKLQMLISMQGDDISTLANKGESPFNPRNIDANKGESPFNPRNIDANKGESPTDEELEFDIEVP
jgi:hypothetical protein